MYAVETPTPHPEFVRRANWRDEFDRDDNRINYPPDDMVDASVWAWEFLRRNWEYQADFRNWKDSYADVPPRPRDGTPLTGYLCEPPPSTPDMPYWRYVEINPSHTICSVKDYIRLRWGLLALPDPGLTGDELVKANCERNDEQEEDGRLKWLFSGNNVEIIGATHSTLADPSRPTFVTAACGANEVLVRLELGGDPKQYAKSLNRELSKFFDGGRRDGHRKIAVYGTTQFDPATGKTAIYIAPFDEGDEDTPVLEIRETGWNELNVRQKSLHYALRMADLLAEFERGQLVLQTKGARTKMVDVPVKAGNWDHLFKALREHFRWTTTLSPEPDADVGSIRTFKRWIDHAEHLTIDGGHARLARADLTDKDD